MKKNFDLIVVGAGPAGLMAAKTAAENKKHSIRVIEHPFANIPKAIAAGTYPMKIGIPALNAFIL